MAAEKILVVDDDNNICELLRLYLEKEGYEVTIAHNGADAVKLFQEISPNLMLLDIMLPVLDGWQVCREVRKFSDKPIIMLTAKGETFDKVLGFELGADDYVVKPFDAKEVMARVKAVLRRSGAGADTAVKEVHYDKLTINLTNYELIVDGAISSLTRFGASITTAIRGRSTSMSSALERSSRESPTNGNSRPFGASATSLRPRTESVSRCYRVK